MRSQPWATYAHSWPEEIHGSPGSTTWTSAAGREGKVLLSHPVALSMGLERQRGLVVSVWAPDSHCVGLTPSYVT